MVKPRFWVVLSVVVSVLSACGGGTETESPDAAIGAGGDATPVPADSGSDPHQHMETFVPYVYQTLSNPNRTPDDIASLMGPDFTLAAWQSEASQYADPGQAASAVMDCCLPAEGSIGPFAANRDIAALLGTDPVQMFPNGAHFELGTNWGPQGEGEAVLVFSLAGDGATFYWSGLVFAPEGFVSPPALALLDMETSLMQALYEREVDIWSLYFSDPFAVAGYQSQAAEYGAGQEAAALDHLLSIYPPEGFLLAYPDPKAEGVEMGSELVGLFPEAVDFVFSTGWGPDGQGEAWLVIGQDASDGSFVWRAILYAPQGFPRG